MTGTKAPGLRNGDGGYGGGLTTGVAAAAGVVDDIVDGEDVPVIM
jgi:hypothetical protein